ncbi:unnamed protein product [Danaus chrysippus]|uniref:(African queen) hypothetical protein n=1 Tax=Danaus chrysippus TaxID=151541 RepID=A0A8J2W7L9_9NEOP|nr:unnamed protein product [Danaus chrysippus]
MLVWGLRPPAPATCPAPCQGERYTGLSASTTVSLSQAHHQLLPPNVSLTQLRSDAPPQLLTHFHQLKQR